MIIRLGPTSRLLVWNRTYEPKINTKQFSRLTELSIWPSKNTTRKAMLAWIKLKVLIAALGYSVQQNVNRIESHCSSKTKGRNLRSVWFAYNKWSRNVTVGRFRKVTEIYFWIWKGVMPERNTRKPPNYNLIWVKVHKQTKCLQNQLR